MWVSTSKTNLGGDHIAVFNVALRLHEQSHKKSSHQERQAQTSYIGLHEWLCKSSQIGPQKWAIVSGLVGFPFPKPLPSTWVRLVPPRFSSTQSFHLPLIRNQHLPQL